MKSLCDEVRRCRLLLHNLCCKQRLHRFSDFIRHRRIYSALGGFHCEALLRKASHSFAKALVVDNLALAEEFDNVVYVGVVGEAEDVIVHRARLLLC